MTTTEAAPETEAPTERVTMVWPKSLKAAVRDKVGPRGLTDFAVAAVERHLTDADPIAASSEEVGELRHLCQLLADRLAMGGTDEDRREALMELELSDWLETTGWPTEMAKLVRPAAPPEKPEVQTPVQIIEDVPAAALGERDDLFARIAAKTGQPVDPGFADLKRASDLEVPEKPPVEPDEHNHAWARVDEILTCECGAWIDMEDPEYPQGIVRDEGYVSTMALTVPDNPPALQEVIELSVASAQMVEVVAVAQAAEPKCPKCGDELVAGECWTCA